MLCLQGRSLTVDTRTGYAIRFQPVKLVVDLETVSAFVIGRDAWSVDHAAPRGSIGLCSLESLMSFDSIELETWI